MTSIRSLSLIRCSASENMRSLPFSSFDTNNDTFRYNEYTDMDEEQFARVHGICPRRQLYDTGVDAEYGDQLMTLSTCEYTYTNGRFVVVAKKV
jgi:sortase B